MRVRDTSGTYYWHIPTGTTQWEPPSPLSKVGDSIMSSTMSLETTPCEEPDVSLAAYFSWNFMHVRKHWLLMLNFPGILGSTFQHWWGSWWNGPVEGKYSGFRSCDLLREAISFELHLVETSILTHFCHICTFSGRGRSSFWSEFEGVRRGNSALCIDQPEVCSMKSILDK